MYSVLHLAHYIIERQSKEPGGFGHFLLSKLFYVQFTGREIGVQ